jgi:hypothetical protein
MQGKGPPLLVAAGSLQVAGEGDVAVSVGVSSSPPPALVGDVPTTDVEVGTGVSVGVAVGVGVSSVAATAVGEGDAVGSKVRKGGKEKSPFGSR